MPWLIPTRRWRRISPTPSSIPAKTLIGSFDTLAGAAILSFNLQSAADSLSLEVTRNSYANLASSHNQGLSSVLDSERAAAEGDFADLGRHLRQVDADAKPGTWTGWLELLGRDAGYRRDGAYDALQADLYGLMLGVERTAAGLTLGAAVAVAENRYESRHSGDDGESDSQQGYLYAAWRESSISG